MPWAITLSGFSLPVVKIGTILSKYLIFLVSIACSVLAGKTFLTIQYSMSPMSKEFGCVTTRCTTASESSAVICRVKPRSALAFSAISLKADTPVPHWRSTMFLLFCAQIVGAPIDAADRGARESPRPLQDLAASHAVHLASHLHLSFVW